MKEKLEIIPAPRERSEEENLRAESRKRQEKEDALGIAGDFVSRMLESSEEFHEKVAIKKDGSFDLFGDVTENTDLPRLLRFAYKVNDAKGLVEFTKEISKKYPNINFNVKFGPKNEWIEYSAKKVNLSPGSSVVWEQDGIVQWREPKKIKSIDEDPKSKRKYALFEDFRTGIPLDELHLSE